MHRRALLAVFLTVSSLGAGSPALVFEQRHVQFGDRYQGEIVEHRFALTNTGQVPVTVIDTVAVDGTGEISVTPRNVPAGATAVAVVRQPLASQLGHTAFRYALITDDPGVDRYRFTLSGFVQSAYDPESPAVDFGVVDRGTGATREFEVSSREVAALRVQSARELPEFLRIEVLGPAGPVGQGQRVQATLRDGVAPGLVSGSFLLRTNVAHQPHLRVFYRANVIGDVVPGENPVQLGVTRIGEILRKEIRLESRTGRPFEVERVADTSELFEWSVDPCDDAGDGCRRLVLQLAPEAPSSLTGRLLVYLSGELEPITLSYRGMVVTQDTVIKKLEIPMTPQSEVEQ
jgi:hypothetical protein